MEDLTLIELKSVSGLCGKGTVKNVSFRLPNGKMYGVFSPRYADAVALCALMSGACTPSKGVVLVGGFDLHREAKQARGGIGYLPADLLPDGELTPIEYLMSVADARALNYDKTLRYVHELLELADLGDKKERLICNLSHGERRTVCFLQTLLGKPEILILSSPFGGVLPKDAQKIGELIKHFSQTHTIFLCTPSHQDLCALCEEVLVLQDGTLKAIVPADAQMLSQEVLAASEANAPTPETQKSRKKTRWSILTQNTDEYEVLDGDGKEDKN